MSNIASLIRNENMKIYYRPRTWVMVLFLIAMLVLMTVLLKWDEGRSAAGGDWRSDLQQSIERNKATLAETPAADDQGRAWLEEWIKKSEYALAHDINPNEQTLWGVVDSSASMIILITILTVIVAADMIAAEFTWGSVKLLLVRPVSRWKILLGKYISTLQFALLLLLISFAVAFALGVITEGFGGLDHPNLYIGSDGAVHEQSRLLISLQKYGLGIVQLLLYVTFAFMVSAAFRSSSMAIAFSILFLLIGNTIVGIFRNYEWIKYTLFANVDLSQYLNGSSPIRPDMTMAFSIGVLAAYFLVFHLISWLLFTKRDVAS